MKSNKSEKNSGKERWCNKMSLEQKRLENHEIYYIGAAELP